MKLWQNVSPLVHAKSKTSSFIILSMYISGTISLLSWYFLVLSQHFCGFFPVPSRYLSLYFPGISYLICYYFPVLFQCTALLQCIFYALSWFIHNTLPALSQQFPRTFWLLSLYIPSTLSVLWCLILHAICHPTFQFTWEVYNKNTIQGVHKTYNWP